MIIKTMSSLTSSKYEYATFSRGK